MINSKKFIQRHFIVKFLKTKDTSQRQSSGQAWYSLWSNGMFLLLLLFSRVLGFNKKIQHVWVSNLSLHGSILKVRTHLPPKLPVNRLVYCIGPNLVIRYTNSEQSLCQDYLLFTGFSYLAWMF